MARRGRLRLVVVLGLVALVVYAGLSVWMTERLLRPERRTPSRDPGSLGLPFESLRLTTSDGLELAAWLVSPPEPARGTVLLAHAKDGCRSAARMAFLAERGFRSLALDLRAHGESEGELTTFGLDEALDILAAKLVVRERWPDAPLIGWGTSLGAAALLTADTSTTGPVARARSAAAPASAPCDGLILESLFADLDTALANRVRLHLGGWALPFFLGPRLLVEHLTQLDDLPVIPVDDLTRLSGRPPLLLATGALDEHATPDDLARLAAAAPWAERCIVPGVGHTDLLADPQGLWRRRVDEFLQRW